MPNSIILVQLQNEQQDQGTLHTSYCPIKYQEDPVFVVSSCKHSRY